MEIRALCIMALGGVFQWVAFGPKKVPMWLAWGCLSGFAVALWVWMTPDAVAQFSSNWRAAVLNIVLFVLSAKGTGSTLKAAGLAPASNSR